VIVCLLTISIVVWTEIARQKVVTLRTIMYFVLIQNMASFYRRVVPTNFQTTGKGIQKLRRCLRDPLGVGFRYTVVPASPFAVCFVRLN
jgi:hypothetical protein